MVSSAFKGQWKVVLIITTAWNECMQQYHNVGHVLRICGSHKGKKKMKAVLSSENEDKGGGSKACERALGEKHVK